MSVLTHPWGQKRAKFEKKKVEKLLHCCTGDGIMTIITGFRNWIIRIAWCSVDMAESHLLKIYSRKTILKPIKCVLRGKKIGGCLICLCVCVCAHRTTLGLAWTLAWRFALGCLVRANFGSRSAICWGYNLKSLLTTKTDYCNQDNKGWLTII